MSSFPRPFHKWRHHERRSTKDKWLTGWPHLINNLILTKDLNDSQQYQFWWFVINNHIIDKQSQMNNLINWHTFPNPQPSVVHPNRPWLGMISGLAARQWAHRLGYASNVTIKHKNVVGFPGVTRWQAGFYQQSFHLKLIFKRCHASARIRGCWFFPCPTMQSDVLILALNTFMSISFGSLINFGGCHTFAYKWFSVMQ